MWYHQNDVLKCLGFKIDKNDKTHWYYSDKIEPLIKIRSGKYWNATSLLRLKQYVTWHCSDKLVYWDSLMECVEQTKNKSIFGKKKEEEILSNPVLKEQKQKIEDLLQNTMELKIQLKLKEKEVENLKSYLDLPVVVTCSDEEDFHKYVFKTGDLSKSLRKLLEQGQNIINITE